MDIEIGSSVSLLFKFKYLGIENGILIFRNTKIITNPKLIVIRQINANLLLIIIKIYLKFKQKIKIQIRGTIKFGFISQQVKKGRSFGLKFDFSH
jgi:hypothetical protein